MNTVDVIALPRGSASGLWRWAAGCRASTASGEFGPCARADLRDDSGDRADVRAALDGDDDAFRRLLERHQQRVSAMMWRFSRVPQAHEELVQDVFVEVYRNLGTFRGTAPFEHWLARIAIRVGYRFWKQRARERRRPTVSLEEWDQLPDQPESAQTPAEAAELLHTLLARLSPRDRLVLTLRYLDGKSVKATAAATGWTVGMVKVQVWRARRKIEKLMKQHYPELFG